MVLPVFERVKICFQNHKKKLVFNGLVAGGQRGGKKESFFIHRKAFGGSIAVLYDRKKAQCGEKSL
jgi:hypothetical protein